MNRCSPHEAGRPDVVEGVDLEHHLRLDQVGAQCGQVGFGFEQAQHPQELCDRDEEHA